MLTVAIWSKVGVTAGFGTLFDAGLAAVAAGRERRVAFGAEIGWASAAWEQSGEKGLAFQAVLGGMFDLASQARHHLGAPALLIASRFVVRFSIFDLGMQNRTFVRSHGVGIRARCGCFFDRGFLSLLR